MEKQFCRICFSERPDSINVFETFIKNSMTIADFFRNYLWYDMFPDDDLPEFVCCDCLVEVMNSDKVDIEWKKILSFLVWRIRILERLKSSGKEPFTLRRPKSSVLNPEEGQNTSSDVSDNDLVKGGCSYEKLSSGFEINSKSEPHMKYTNSALHQCNLCSGVFFNSGDLKRHKNMFHNIDESFPCGRCWKKFPSWETLTRHIEEYNFQCKFEADQPASIIPDPKLTARVKKEIEYSCSECAFCSSKSELILHITDVHSSECPIFCRICRTGFISRMRLGLHQVIHMKKFFCSVCEREFLTQRYYNKHVKFCQNKDVVNKCKVCGMELSTRGNLRLHMTSHSILRKFKCSLCPKTYKMNRHLLKHVRCFHLKLKSHECLICNKSFTLKGTLNGHYASHSEDRPYSCSSCEKRFKLTTTRNRHEKDIHSIYRPQKRRIIVDEHLLEKITSLHNKFVD